jgi:hypothetical protein
VQIYTDNMGKAVSNPIPKYTGPVSSTQSPAGLVDVSTPTLVLPLAWLASQTLTNDLAITQVMVSTNATLPTSGGHQFQWMKDASDPTFINGDDSTTVWNQEGIHFSPGPRLDIPATNYYYWRDAWGAARSPIYIYLAGGFSSAVTPHTYQTSTLIVEYYSM